MTGIGPEPEGATPLEPDDMAGLRRTDIAMRDELNKAEAENIATAYTWSITRRASLTRLLTQKYLRDLHRRMFGDVWRWAGNFRTRETSIGINPHYIIVELENLLLDVQAQTAERHRLPWTSDEIAVRFHHRLVSIHPFVNGNGRHARLVADLLASELGRPAFTWGHAGDLTSASAVRNDYLKALRIADQYIDYQPLLTFART